MQPDDLTVDRLPAEAVDGVGGDLRRLVTRNAYHLSCWACLYLKALLVTADVLSPERSILRLIRRRCW